MGWIGLSLIQGAGRHHSIAGKVDLEAPVFFGVYTAHFNVRFGGSFRTSTQGPLMRQLTDAVDKGVEGSAER
jgi:hypothetical protein